MLVPLSVLIPSFSDGGLVVSVALMTLHLLSDQPAGGFLTVGDGLIFTEGLGLLTSIPSSQSEEKHQQCVSPLLSQYSQYLLKKLVPCFTSPSKSVRVITAVWVGSVKISGEYSNSWPVGMSVSDVLSSVCTLTALWGVLPFFDFTRYLGAFSHVCYFSILVWVFWIMVNFPHVLLTLISISRVPSGILQNRYLFRLQVALSDFRNAILKGKYWNKIVQVWVRIAKERLASIALRVCFWSECYSHSHSRL